MEAEPLWPVLEEMGTEVGLTGGRRGGLQHCLNKFYLQLSVGRVHVCVCVRVLTHTCSPQELGSAGVSVWPSWPLPCSAHKYVNWTGPDLGRGSRVHLPHPEPCPLGRVLGHWQKQKAGCFSQTFLGVGGRGVASGPPKMATSRCPGSVTVVPQAEGTVQMGFSEGSGDGGRMVLMIGWGPSCHHEVPYEQEAGGRVGEGEDRGRGQDLRWAGVLSTLKMGEGISGLEKWEKSGKRDPPHPEHLEGSSPANTLVLAP